MLPERRDIRTGGELLPDARPPQSPRRGVLARRVVMLPGDQPQQYAAVSGDYQRLHFDDNVARAAGLEKAVVQGACTLAICAAIATDVAAGSDPTRLARVVGRFAHPVYPESRLVVEVSEPVEGTDPAVHSVRATRNGRPVVRGGRVDVRP
jgi:acyl dehydratase